MITNLKPTDFQELFIGFLLVIPAMFTFINLFGVILGPFTKYALLFSGGTVKQKRDAIHPFHTFSRTEGEGGLESSVFSVRIK